MSFPITRLRRLRQTPVLRNLVRETILTRDDLVMHATFCLPRNRRKQPDFFHARQFATICGFIG